MTKIIMELLMKMKLGVRYKKLMKQTIQEYTHSNSKLVTGAKIKYVAQSTFHTMK